MTTLEHALLGSAGAMAAGLHRRGWQIVALAGVAATVPDWDGLSLVFGAVAFDRLHRAAGHSLLVATALAILLALIEYRGGLIRAADLPWQSESTAFPCLAPPAENRHSSGARPRPGAPAMVGGRDPGYLEPSGGRPGFFRAMPAFRTGG